VEAALRNEKVRGSKSPQLHPAKIGPDAETQVGLGFGVVAGVAPAYLCNVCNEQ